MKRAPKSPALRFPEFHDPWVVKKLGEVAVIIDGDRGKNYPKSTDFTPAGYCLFLNAGNVTTRGFRFNSNAFISSKKEGALGKGRLKRGDVVLTTRGTVGNVALFDAKVPFSAVRINSGMVLLRVNQEILNASFLIITFDAPAIQTQIRRTTFGSAQPQLTVRTISKFMLPLPSLPEQKKIAAFLTAVDRRIEKLEKKRALLTDYKKGLMQQLFSQSLRFTNPDGSPFPPWQQKRLGEVADINPPVRTLPDTFVYIDLDAVSAGRLQECKILAKRLAPSRAQRLLRKGDILYQMVRPYQRNNLLFQEDGETVASTGYAQLRAGAACEYLYHALHTDCFVESVLARCTGTSYPAINSNDLARIQVPWPSASEQKKIADCLSAIDRKIEQVDSQVAQSREFKKGLLQRMFV
jgi:type I restriction enzyme S subunit